MTKPKHTPRVAEPSQSTLDTLRERDACFSGMDAWHPTERDCHCQGPQQHAARQAIAWLLQQIDQWAVSRREIKRISRMIEAGMARAKGVWDE